MLSTNPQRGMTEKLRLMYAFKCEDCSTGLCLTLLLLLALEAFMQWPPVGGKMEALPLLSLLLKAFPPQTVRPWEQAGFFTFLRGVPSSSTPHQKARGVADIYPPAVFKG